MVFDIKAYQHRFTGLILGLHPANERHCYFVTASLIGWVHLHEVCHGGCHRCSKISVNAFSNSTTLISYGIGNLHISSFTQRWSKLHVHLNKCAKVMKNQRTLLLNLHQNITNFSITWYFIQHSSGKDEKIWFRTRIFNSLLSQLNYGVFFEIVLEKIDHAGDSKM